MNKIRRRLYENGEQCRFTLMIPQLIDQHLTKQRYKYKCREKAYHMLKKFTENY